MFTKKIFLLFALIVVVLGCEIKKDDSLTTPPTPTPPTLEYTVTFNTDGGNVIASVKVQQGDKLTKPTDPTRNNYIFGSWYKEKDLSTLFDFDKETITANITIYAKWGIQKHTVTFDTDEGNLITSVEVVHGGKVSQPNDPTKSGYIFKGWYKEKNLMTPFDFNKEVLTTDTTIYAKWGKVIKASMAWVSMREGLVQFDNGTEGVKTIGVIVSREATPPAYASIKSLPGFYTRKTKIDGTPRTVYLSMTDKMTTDKFGNLDVVPVDGAATGFVSAITSVPEILHPNTDYYVHFYEITGATGIAIEKLKFTTEDFPTTYPTSRVTVYSSFYNQITASSSSPAMEYKASETYLIPVRIYFDRVATVLNVGSSITYHVNTFTPTRPFNDLVSNETTKGVLYDLYDINSSGPTKDVFLWDGMMGVFNSIQNIVNIQDTSGDPPTQFYDNKKAVLVTE